MFIKSCRVCNSAFFPEPLLQYTNMPKAAQNFPDENSVATEKGVDLNIYQCSGCGLVQLSNETVPYYKEVIRASGFSDEMRNFRLNQFQEFVKKYKLIDKKVIEIGCGKGEYLSLMKQVGAKASGIEFSETSVQSCVDQELNVSKNFIDKEDQKLLEAPYDGFFIMSFLEHLPNPNATLKGIANNLSEEGIGLIEVPNFDMILQKALFSEFIGDHLFYFTKDTFISTLERNGFEVLECTNVWYDYIISAVVKKRKKVDLSHFSSVQEQLTVELNNYIDKYGEKNVAVWGAGHQALALIALAKIGDKIKYVVDSAPFKQNKFTPATHIPIVAPQKLSLDPVKAIIVMAAAYSDEVANIIQTKFDKKINLSIVRDFGLETI